MTEAAHGRLKIAPDDMNGRHVVLTGAAGGIGSLVATRLKARGAYVTGVDLVECPGCDQTLCADLANEVELAALAARLAAWDADTLVNLAGSQYFGPAETQEPANIRAGYTINLIAPALFAPSCRGCGSVARARS